MKERTNKYLIAALLLGILFHGTTIFFTLESTYDALIHLFFANHYAGNWFEPWNYSWYTGFTVMGYPPLVHQAMALLSTLGGLKFGLFTVALIGIILFITGVYRFSLLLTGSRKSAGYAALLAVFSSSFIETLHIFGQLPSIIGISVLLHSLPEIYLWLKTGKIKYLITSLSLIAVTVTSHHVTPIFGMIFFIFPLIGMVLMDASKEKVGSFKAVTFKVFLKSFFSHLKRIISFGFGSLFLIIFCILPYWINTKNNPITQVPIPHGSRDNFLEVTSSGLVFFLIPWGFLLCLLPFLFYRYFQKRYLFFGLSLALLTILGTGGTTPIPKMILGENAFNILTLDRFTLWASIMVLPMFGEFTYRFVEGDLKKYIQQRWGAIYHRLSGGVLISIFIFMAIFTVSLGHFRPSQPQKINMLPIVNFLNQDQHDQWRYLSLGFGDQMAWLSTQTKATTVDGNYHSARRLPELTSRAVERLENSKFRGVEGIGSLQQFLTVPEKYHLKYIFSNDKFYDPILYFTGWHRLQQLENGIIVWERAGISPLPKILPKEDVSLVLKLMWGIIPLLTVVIALLLNLVKLWKRTFKIESKKVALYLLFKTEHIHFNRKLVTLSKFWIGLLFLLAFFSTYQVYIKNASHISPKNLVAAYYDALDYKEFEKAHSFLLPTANKSLEQYMLEISVSDGLLSSYAKLDAISIKTLSESKTEALLEVTTHWITSLQKYKKLTKVRVKRFNNKWYLVPAKTDLDIPPDQFFSENKPKFYNHGRRRISSEQTYHEDILKQPYVEVISAKLVKKDSQYVIIGMLQNIDNIPADVSIKATLYNETNDEITHYDAKDVIKHKLLPKETTPFRIDFEGIAWATNESKIPNTFNPNEFTEVSFNEIPIIFNIQIQANVAVTDLYDDLSLNALEINDNTIKGTLFNTGIQNATIPELLVCYYNKNKELIWVNNHYLEESVRPQRKRSFTIEVIDYPALEVLKDSTELIFINGKPNTEIKLNTSEIIEPSGLIPIHQQSYHYISIKLNTYVANPI